MKTFSAILWRGYLDKRWGISFVQSDMGGRYTFQPRKCFTPPNNRNLDLIKSSLSIFIFCTKWNHCENKMLQNMLMSNMSVVYLEHFITVMINGLQLFCFSNESIYKFCLWFICLWKKEMTFSPLKCRRRC